MEKYQMYTNKLAIFCITKRFKQEHSTKKMESGKDKSTKFYENLNMQSGMTEMPSVRREVTIEMSPASSRVAIEISQVRGDGTG